MVVNINPREEIAALKERGILAENKLKEWTDTFPYRTPSDITLSLNELQTKLAIEKGETKEQGSQTELTLAELDDIQKIAVKIYDSVKKTGMVTEEIENKNGFLFRLKIVEQEIVRFIEEKQALLQNGEQSRRQLKDLLLSLNNKSLTIVQLEEHIKKLEQQLTRQKSELQKSLEIPNEEWEELLKRTRSLRDKEEENKITIKLLKKNIEEDQKIISVFDQEATQLKKQLSQQLELVKDKEPNDVEKKLMSYFGDSWRGKEEDIREELETGILQNIGLRCLENWNVKNDTEISYDWSQLRGDYIILREIAIELLSNTIVRKDLEESLCARNEEIKKYRKDIDICEDAVISLKSSLKDAQESLKLSKKKLTKSKVAYKEIKNKINVLHKELEERDKKLKSSQHLFDNFHKFFNSTQSLESLIWGRSWKGFFDWLTDNVIKNKDYVQYLGEHEHTRIDLHPEEVGITQLYLSLWMHTSSNLFDKWENTCYPFYFKEYDDNKPVSELVFRRDGVVIQPEKFNTIDSLRREYQEQSSEGVVKKLTWKDFYKWLVENISDTDSNPNRTAYMRESEKPKYVGLLDKFKNTSKGKGSLFSGRYTGMFNNGFQFLISTLESLEPDHDSYIGKTNIEWFNIDFDPLCNYFKPRELRVTATRVSERREILDSWWSGIGELINRWYRETAKENHLGQKLGEQENKLINLIRDSYLSFQSSVLLTDEQIKDIRTFDSDRIIRSLSEKVPTFESLWKIMVNFFLSYNETLTIGDEKNTNYEKIIQDTIKYRNSVSWLLTCLNVYRNSTAITISSMYNDYGFEWLPWENKSEECVDSNRFLEQHNNIKNLIFFGFDLGWRKDTFETVVNICMKKLKYISFVGLDKRALSIFERNGKKYFDVKLFIGKTNNYVTDIVHKDTNIPPFVLVQDKGFDIQTNLLEDKLKFSL